MMVRLSHFVHAAKQAARKALPGVALCFLLAALAWLLERLEARILGRPYVEAIVLAIIVGAVVRTAWTPGARWSAGIAVSSKLLLEIAVVLLGVLIDAAVIIKAGPVLLAGVVLVVAVGLTTGYAISRAAGLRHRLAILIACGNAICGNSAIAAVAPVIGADGSDVAASIAFTAVLGVAAVLGLPVLGHVFHLSVMQYGALAGLTVYAVPQVLAATLSVSATSAQVGTLVKLVRVLMLGPVVLGLSLAQRRDRPALSRLVPWFIIGFVLAAVARTTGVVPASLTAPIRDVATALTVLSMAALGLAVDVRALARVGHRVIAAVCGSLAVIVVVSVLLVRTMR
ncbi:MAG TPA: putative sulfate exporter family transporter [Gemmatimonadaceae bacterium]|jgi:uncharacterized integral membrane protein (TIGR00698 family)|nr:putative sulfate exporter family transporter [Gemmatimonadaceae bacterium]